MSGSTSKPTIQELLSYPKFKCGPRLLQDLKEDEQVGLLLMAEHLMEEIFDDNDKRLMFSCLQPPTSKDDKKQLNDILKQEYGATVADYDKTASPLGLQNSYIKAVIFNVIMDVILHTYTASNDDKVRQEMDSDDDPEFGKPISSTPDADLSMVTADGDEHQSTADTNPVNKDDLFIPVMSKSKRKRERKKAKAQAAAAAKQNSTVLLDKQHASSSTTSRDIKQPKSKTPAKLVSETKLTNNKVPTLNKGIKAAKVGKQDANHVITGYEPDDCNLAWVRDIIVYDVPASWTTQYLLQELRSWGKPISLSRKTQKKYSTVRVKIELVNSAAQAFDQNTWVAPLGNFFVRWFPAAWNLKERKRRELFQAALYDVPASMTYSTLKVDGNVHPFLREANAKAYKLVKLPDGTTKLIAFLESWDALNALIGKKIKWMDQDLKWARHATPTSLAGKRKSTTTNFSSPNSNQLKKNPKTVASGSNTIPITPRSSSKKTHTNCNNQEKKPKTSTLTGKVSKSESKYSKKALYAEIKSLKKTLKKLCLD
jgi:hypothetical protein